MTAARADAAGLDASAVATAGVDASVLDASVLDTSVLDASGVRLVLAIDTSAGTSVAVVDAERGILSEVAEVGTMRHAEVIGRLIGEALDAAGVNAADVDAVATGMGPGPFTGLRVGIAAARAFAIGRGVAELAVVSHDAVAEQLRNDGVRGDVLVITDARRHEVYWSLFSLTAGRAVRLDGPGLSKPDDLPHPAAPRTTAVQVSAGALGRVALRRLADGAPSEAHEALYLRSPDVTISAGAKRVTQ